jgi:hypothetical protein
LCSFYTKSTEQLIYFQKTGLRGLNIVCGQREYLKNCLQYVLKLRTPHFTTATMLALCYLDSMCFTCSS